MTYLRQVPKINKMIYKSEIFVERCLPIEGTIVVKVGDTVEPVTRLGMTKVSYGVMNMPTSLKLAKGKLEDGYFYEGEKIGSVGTRHVIAPFNGYLSKGSSGAFALKQEQRDYWLLSGVWGVIADYVDKRSALIKTQALDIPLVACTHGNAAGELIVFPNPADFLTIHYLEKFAGDVSGKIIYTGDFVTSALVTRAKELNVGGIIAGSTDKSTFILAKKQGIFLGIISAFGRTPTPPFIFDVLKQVSNRFVFVSSSMALLRLPVAAREATTETSKVNSNPQGLYLSELLPGKNVQVFEKPYYGWTGTIDSVQGDQIYVKLHDVSDLFKVSIPNVIVIDYDSV